MTREQELEKALTILSTQVIIALRRASTINSKEIDWVTSVLPTLQELLGVVPICDVCKKTTFCNRSNTIDYFLCEVCSLAQEMKEL